MGVEVVVEGLTKSFGKQTIWRDVTLSIPPGEVSVMLGPSGTGKSVFLKSLVGLLKPEQGKIIINGTDLVRCSEHKLYEIRKMFGVLFQDGALFGSMNLFDNVAFPLREHTRKTEAEVRRIVLEKIHRIIPEVERPDARSELAQRCARAVFAIQHGAMTHDGNKRDFFGAWVSQCLFHQR